MQKTAAEGLLAEYNRIMKECDDIYREASKRLGLPDAAFWILYVLRADGEGLTQSQICDILYQPKQTTHSAIKHLESGGFVEFRAGDNRRSKRLFLTKGGTQLAGSTVDRVIGAENRAFSQMTEQERGEMLGLLRKYTALLRDNMKEIRKEKEL